jgi:hypothetical protein
MKKTDTLIKIVSVLALLAIVCYIGYYIYDARANPLRTVAAMEYTVTETAETTGYAVRTEEPLTGDKSRVAIIADEGEKLAVNSVYGLRFDSGESMGLMDRIRSLNTRIDWLQNVVDGGAGAADRMARESVAALSYGVDSGSEDSISDLIDDVRIKVFQSESFTDENLELSLENAKSELEGLEADMESGAERLTIPRSGIFSTHTDGFETVNADALGDITPQKLENLFKTAESSGDALGKIVSDIRWRYVAVMAEEDAMRLRVDSEATLQFTGNYNKTITMTVEARSQPSLGKCAVTFVSDHNLKDIIDLRQLTADLLVSRTSGIRIPKEAMREAVRETEKDDGETETANVNCIYIISGVQAEQVDVNILAEYDDFYLVEPTTRLRDGTEVITEANDLYDGKVVR